MESCRRAGLSEFEQFKLVEGFLNEGNTIKAQILSEPARLNGRVMR